MTVPETVTMVVVPVGDVAVEVAEVEMLEAAPIVKMGLSA